MDEARLELLGQVAVWYYEDNLDQAEIARRIGKSRSMISKMLNEVRELGFVETRVHYPLRRDLNLETELCQSFGLDQANGTPVPVIHCSASWESSLRSASSPESLTVSVSGSAGAWR
ncbi:MAG: hypothetical protein ACOC4I_01195 [Spirochaetota bacterium]